jgi:hypothetical protein
MALINRGTPLVAAAVFNVIRNVSIGSLMMPLLTWGTSCVKSDRLADASSLLTSFRTISGSIGSAVFVGIMTTVGSASVVSYGDGALMHGLNMAFAAMGLSALILAVLAVWSTSE